MSKTSLARLKRQLKGAGITQDRIADEANVTRPMVNHVLNGRAKSRKVIAAIERLLLVGREDSQSRNKTDATGEGNARIAS